jgi:hypothetical protein
VRIINTLAAILCSAAISQASTIVLNFQNLDPGNVPGPLFIQSPYQDQGFAVSSTLGFDTYGTGLTNFFAGAHSLSPIIGSAVELKALDKSPFSLSSIDLARNFAFDPAPVLTLTAMLAGGGTVNQTFSVTTPVGAAAFQTFQLSNFTNVIAVDWNQPASAAQGLHQFTNLVIETGAVSPVPEPSSFLTVGLVLFAFGLVVTKTAKWIA